jgi:diaminopropionate ammonia-lyase
MGGHYNRGAIAHPSPSFAFLPTAFREPSGGLFSRDEYDAMRRFFGARPSLAATPLHALAGAAAKLGIGSLLAKDETGRFGLDAFKLTGALFAVESLVASHALKAGATLVCASEGNHGRAVARAARGAGCAARVYMAHDAAPARVDAIAREGAAVVRVNGSYDDAVRQAAGDAAQHGWTVISDTSWPGYEEIPRRIMLGYTRVMDEIRDPFDIVFAQGGVGGLLCAVASWCAFHRREARPRVVSVEPLQAACLLASARAGRPVAVEGPLETTMAGLRNREVSFLAFAAAQPLVDAYIAIADGWAHDAMRLLAHPIGSDPPIRAGASGAGALGGVLAVLRDPALEEVRGRIALDSRSRVLAIVSEGATDPEVWRAVVG